MSFSLDFNGISAVRRAAPKDIAEPVRIAEIGGHPLPLYASQSPSCDLPWPDLAALYDVIGLAPDRRSDFSERHGIVFPALAIVQTGHGKVAVVVPEAALRCIAVAERAGLDACLVTALQCAIGATEENADA